MTQCPNCGDALSAAAATAILAVCESCHSTLYRIDDRLKKAGDAGVMQDAPLLVGLGDQVTLERQIYTAVGHARFSYGPGWWDEFWLDAGQDDGAWLSIDEGDVIVQRPFDTRGQKMPKHTNLGARVALNGETYSVTEVDQGTCIALRGTFPEVMAVGDTYRYANLTGPGGLFASLETHAGESAWFLGRWLDPFELKVDRQ